MRWTSGNPWQYDWCHHRTYRGCCRSAFDVPAGSAYQPCQAYRRLRRYCWRKRKTWRICCCYCCSACSCRSCRNCCCCCWRQQTCLCCWTCGDGCPSCCQTSWSDWTWIYWSRILTGLFPVTGINGMCEFLHVLKGLRFSLLSYDVLDSFGQSGVIAVTEYAVIPMHADC